MLDFYEEQKVVENVIEQKESGPNVVSYGNRSKICSLRLISVSSEIRMLQSILQR